MSPMLKAFHNPVDHWEIVLIDAQAKIVLSEDHEEIKSLERLCEIIRSHKTIMDMLLDDYNNGRYTRCPYHTINIPPELVVFVELLLPK